MKKKNVFQVSVINNSNNNGLPKNNLNLTKKFKTPRGDEKRKKRKHTKEKENKENNFKNTTKNSIKGNHINKYYI